MFIYYVFKYEKQYYSIKNIYIFINIILTIGHVDITSG